MIKPRPVSADLCLTMSAPVEHADFGSWGMASAEPSGAVVDADAVAEPEAAIRGRLNAAVLDGLLLGVITEIVVHARGGALFSAGSLLFAYVGQFLYFWACESAWGQTLGKRAYGIRVVSLDGTPASTRQIAVRNVLRFIDALPAFYASGLISLLRTGSARRQRIGDVAARTTVVLEPGRRRQAPHPSLLRIATLLAVTLSVLVIVGSVRHADQSSAPPAPAAVTP